MFLLLVINFYYLLQCERLCETNIITVYYQLYHSHYYQTSGSLSVAEYIILSDLLLIMKQEFKQ